MWKLLLSLEMSVEVSPRARRPEGIQGLNTAAHAAVSALGLIYEGKRPLSWPFLFFCVMTFKSFLTSLFLMEWKTMKQTLTQP